MNAARLANAVAIALAVLSTLYAVEAHPCAPPMYEMYDAEILEEDTPECVTFRDFPQHHYDGDRLMVSLTNDCDRDLELHIVDCPTYDAESTPGAGYTCGDLVAGPGATEWLVVEERPTYDLDDGEANEQLYAWHLGDEEGIVHTRYEFDDPHHDIEDTGDDEGGCAMMMKDNHPFAGCSTAGASLPMDTLILLAVVFGALTVRRYWSSRPATTRRI